MGVVLTDHTRYILDYLHHTERVSDVCFKCTPIVYLVLTCFVLTDTVFD